LSSIFKTRKNNSYLGVVKFNFLTINYNIKVIALGGIDEKNFKKIKLTKAVGIAGISKINQIKKNGPI
jgi:thiamine-phosphate pyrophosphorylase